MDMRRGAGGVRVRVRGCRRHSGRLPGRTPGRSSDQSARREWSTEPDVRIRHYTDLYGNPCARAMLPAGRSTLRFDALVLVPDATEEVGEQVRELPPEELPDEVLIGTLPSRYCLPDMLGDLGLVAFRRHARLLLPGTGDLRLR